MTRVGVVGAGLSGRLLVLNLYRHARSDIEVIVVDRCDESAMGAAYSSDDDHLLLNVSAGQLSAFDDDRDDFVAWARQQAARADAHSFLPRRLYRQYVFERLRQARDARPEALRLEQRRAEATDVTVTSHGVVIRAGADQLSVDRVVLALGNFPPRQPPLHDAGVLESARYVGDPWRPGALEAVAPNDSVVLIGTGQTATDLIVTLGERGHRGSIVAVSRHGLLPLAHVPLRAYPSFTAELAGAERLIDLFRVVRRHLRRATASGFDGRAVIDSLRPATQSIWLGLPDHDKRLFLRHLFRHWEIVRSRIPPRNAAVIAAMRASGRLAIVAARVVGLDDNGAHMTVDYRGHDGAVRRWRADVVVDCMGPEVDYERIDQPLVRNLLARGLVRPGPAGLGLDALPDGTIIGRDGRPSLVLSTLGPPLRGVLWETIAVPEIRVQARELARRLLQTGP